MCWAEFVVGALVGFSFAAWLLLIMPARKMPVKGLRMLIDLYRGFLEEKEGK